MNENDQASADIKSSQGKQQTKQIVAADGEPLAPDTETERSAQRRFENNEYVSVIVKRTDETFRHPDDILEKAIKEGMEQLERPLFSLFLSAIAAGLILGFTVLVVAVISALTQVASAEFARIATALVYPLGFVLCILSRTQLFTEHTATAVYPVLDARSNFRKLFRLWLVIICGNLLGGFASANMLVAVEPVVQAQQGYVYLAQHLTHFSGKTLFISGVLAGWLMALGAWIVLSTSATSSQMLSIYIVTFIIGVGGLHHSIAGSIELFTALLLTDVITWFQATASIMTILSGNLVGGSVFVAVLNYGHIRHSQRVERRKNMRKSAF